MSFKAWTKEKEIREDALKKRKKDVLAAYKKMRDEFNAKYPKPENKLDFFRRKRIWKFYSDNFFANFFKKLGC
ncbi:MAG TPA: hypothetical protein PLY41_07180 [Acetomicrobium sp.]|nr:hypothetical protein [Acetomicrobium sp.]